jgi:hypothetical protein
MISNEKAEISKDFSIVYLGFKMSKNTVLMAKTRAKRLNISLKSVLKHEFLKLLSRKSYIEVIELVEDIEIENIPKND